MKENINVAFEIKIMDNMITRQIIITNKEMNIPFVFSPVQAKIIHYLYKNQNDIISQKDIEKLIASRRSTTSGILNTMEKNNLIKRINNQDDARSKQIILTDYSIEISKKMNKVKTKFEKKIKENISKEELDTFFKVTEKIKNNIMNM